MSRNQEDLRVRRTRKLLWEALMTELSERAFEQITIKQICERAMVHRTTFYQHYEDKEALLEQGTREMYARLIAEVTAPPSAFSLEEPPPYFVHLFTHVAQHQHFYRVMLCGERGGAFQKLLKEYLAEQTEAKIRAFTSSIKNPAAPAAMYAQFFAGAIISTLAWWLEQGMPYAPQQMAHYLLVCQEPAGKCRE
jgi:AcrR family transcriptional regulator